MIGLWLIAILIVGLSVYRLAAYHAKVKNYYKVPAVVTGIDVKTVDNDLTGPKYYYAAIFRYTANDGVVREMVSGEDNPDRPLYRAGDEVTLLIHPADSSKFLVNDVINGYIIPIIWLTIATALVAVPYMFPEQFTDL